MRSTCLLALFAVGAVLCAFYLECGSAATSTATTSKDKPASLTNAEGKVLGVNKKQTNGSELIHPTLLRAKRSRCSYREHFSHRCRNDCECSRQRYCSSYGFCHSRNRERRNDEDDVEEDVNESDNELY